MILGLAIKDYILNNNILEMVCDFNRCFYSFRLGIYQDFQKEGEIGKKDQAEQTYAQLDQIQD